MKVTIEEQDAWTLTHHSTDEDRLSFASELRRLGRGLAKEPIDAYQSLTLVVRTRPKSQGPY